MKSKDIPVYAVATGKIPRILTKKVKAALEVIRKQEGLIGVHPVKDYGSLWLFDTENHAKVARNEMRSAGIEVGRNISQVYIDYKYLEK